MDSEFNPWRKHRIIQGIAAVEIVLATFSIFYTGKILLVIFEGLHSSDWLLVFLTLSITFGIQIFHIVLAMLLLRASRETSSTLPKSIIITKIWLIVSVNFLVLLVVELYVGLTTFEYNDYIVLFVVFVVVKVVWRIFSIFYVQMFKQDLETGLSNRTRNNATVGPVFRMILTSPENCDEDVTDNELSQTRNQTVHYA